MLLRDPILKKIRQDTPVKRVDNYQPLFTADTLGFQEFANTATALSYENIVKAEQQMRSFVEKDVLI
jgi:hypothetical protein